MIWSSDSNGTVDLNLFDLNVLSVTHILNLSYSLSNNDCSDSPEPFPDSPILFTVLREHNFILNEDTTFIKMKHAKTYREIVVLCIFVKNLQ